MVFEVSVKFLWNWVLQTVNMQQNSILIRLFPDKRSDVSRPASLQTECFIAPNKERKEKLICRFLKASKTCQYSETVLSKKETIELKHVGRMRFTDFPGDYTCSSFMVAITRKKKEKKLTSACIWKLACIVWLTLKPITDHKWLEICLWTLNSINLIACWSTEFSGNVAPSTGLLF